MHHSDPAVKCSCFQRVCFPHDEKMSCLSRVWVQRGQGKQGQSQRQVEALESPVYIMQLIQSQIQKNHKITFFSDLHMVPFESSMPSYSLSFSEDRYYSKLLSPQEPIIIKCVLELYSKETSISFRDSRHLVMKTQMIRDKPKKE